MATSCSSSILGLRPSPLQAQPTKASHRGTQSQSQSQSTMLAIKPHHGLFSSSSSSSSSVGQPSPFTSSSIHFYGRRRLAIPAAVIVSASSSSSSSSSSCPLGNTPASLTRSSRGDGYGRRRPIVSVSAASASSSPSLSSLSPYPSVSQRNTLASLIRTSRDGYGRRPTFSAGAISASSSSSSSSSSPSPTPSVSPRNTPAFYDSRFGVLGAPLFFYSEKMLPAIASVSPLAGVKWAALAALLLSGGKALVSAVSNPIFLTYASWFFVVWPWPVAILLGIWASVTFAYYSAPGRPKIPEITQLLLLATALIWTLLVPLAHFNGYVDGWPLVLFSVYFVFFLLTSLVRLRLYGELIPRSKDPKWIISPPVSSQIAFVASVVAGHWMAAYEAPRFIHTWRLGWGSYLAVGVLISALVVHYTSSYYLGKYFDRMSRPKVVVRFGPYRWVRHPIYTSYMLLFAGFCLAIRATWSMAFLLFACILYYEQRAQLEEQAMVDAFGEQYPAYAEKVTKRFLPYLY